MIQPYAEAISSNFRDLSTHSIAVLGTGEVGCVCVCVGGGGGGGGGGHERWGVWLGGEVGGVAWGEGTGEVKSMVGGMAWGEGTGEVRSTVGRRGWGYGVGERMEYGWGRTKAD